MYIHANIDDCALVINDFLPQELFNKISKYNYIAAGLKLKGTQTSYENWGETLYQDTAKNKTMRHVNQVCNIGILRNKKITVSDNILKEFLNILTTCPFLPYQDDIFIQLHYYEYLKFSGINWHTDDDYTLNYSFYIHEKWDKNWGGETLIDTQRGVPLALHPEPNSLVTIKNGIPHKVCCISGPKKRKVLQLRGIFLKD